jgi:hypothetical protein
MPGPVGPGGPHPGGPPRAGGGGGAVKVVVVLLLLLVVGGGVLLVATSGGDDAESDESGESPSGNGNGGGGSDGGAAASPDTPVGAVEAFFAAVADGDCGAAAGLVVQNSSSDEMLQACQSAPDEFSAAVELVDAQQGEQIDESTALVDVTYSYQVVSGGGAIDEEPTTSLEGVESTTVPVTMVLEGDTWKLDVSTLDAG